MVFEKLYRWITRQHGHSKKDLPDTDMLIRTDNTAPVKKFSPMTYQNPFIMYIQSVMEQILKKKNIPCQKLELIIIDAEADRDEDDNDIENVLYELAEQLNYLLLVTDRPEKFEDFMEMAYEENGLIVQHIPKTARKRARGNLVMDFERSTGIGTENMKSGTVYLPVYKRPWEIGENLDIIVPVGYNTLVVRDIFPSDFGIECLTDENFVKDRKSDRLDREFRKG